MAKSYSFDMIKAIHYWILDHEGKGFTIMRKYESTKNLCDTTEEDYYSYLHLCKKLPPEITVNNSHKKNIFNKHFQGEISIIVPDEYSREIFCSLFYEEAERFKKYLKANRYDLLKIFSDRVKDANGFEVSQNTITSINSENPCVFFEREGLLPLSGTAQCYGLALAIAEVLHHDFDSNSYIHNDHSTHSLENCWNGFIRIKFPIKSREQKPLEAW